MLVIRFFAGLVHRLPRRYQWAIGRFLGYLWWDVLRLRRFTLYRNITIAFPEASKAERIRMVKESLVHLGMTFVEVMTLPAIDKQWVNDNVVFDGIENYQKAKAKGRGVLFLSLHLANGDLGATALSLQGFPLHLISKKFKLKWLNDVWWRMRAEKGTRFINAHGSENAFHILKALRAQDDIVFVLDQFMGRPYGIPTRFFGVETATAYGLALFAAKTRAPVVPVYLFRTKDLTTHLVFGPEVEFCEVEDKDLQMKQMTQKYNGVLEEIIRAHPEQWMWVHRRWKKWE